MSQNFTTNTPPATTSGASLASQIDQRSDALLTSHSGVARPSYAKEGTFWLKNDGDPRELYFYDGSTDVLIAQVTSGGELTFALGDELNGIGDLTVAVNRILYKNGAGSWDQAAITAFARTLIATSDAAAARAALDASKGLLNEPDFASDDPERPPSQQSAGTYFRGLMLGVDQTWQDLTASRASNTIYQNTTGKPIQVNVIFQESVGNGVTSAQVSSDGVSWLTQALADPGDAITRLKYWQNVIPDGSYYRLLNAPSTLYEWNELR